MLLLNIPIFRNIPDDKSDCPISIDDAIELFNQLSTYMGKNDFIGGQIRAHFFKSVHKSAKCAFGRKIAHFFDVL